MPEGFVEIKKKTYEDGCITPVGEPYYPCGTSLILENEMIEDLGVAALTVGDVVEVRALAVVTSKSERTDENTEGSNSDKHIGIQLTQMKIKREPDQDRAKTLYG